MHITLFTKTQFRDDVAVRAGARDTRLEVLEVPALAPSRVHIGADHRDVLVAVNAAWKV